MKQTFLVLGLLIIGSFAHAEPVTPLQAVVVNGETILATTAGLSVYTYDPDTTTASNCNGGCAKAWPPILVPAGATLQEPMGSITRQDGSQQLTYEQHPLYTFAHDAKLGDVNGDGLGGVWHLVVEAK